MNQSTKPNRVGIGAIYHVELVRNGEVVDSETVRNIVPIEGLNHAVSVIMKQGAQAAAWYVGLFEGNYSPVPGDTATYGRHSLPASTSGGPLGPRTRHASSNRGSNPVAHMRLPTCSRSPYTRTCVSPRSAARSRSASRWAR